MNRWLGWVVAMALIPSFGCTAMVPGPGKMPDATVRSELEFLSPRDGQIIAGDYSFIWVAQTSILPGDPARRVVFETSLDGKNFTFLPRQSAPDFGPGSHTTALDTTVYPPGPLFIRARFKDRSTGPVVRALVRRLPKPSCMVTKSETGDEVIFDCSASRDETDEMVSYAWNFGDGSKAVTSVPIISHVYSQSGQFPFQVTVTNSAGLSATLLRRLIFPRGEPQFQAKADDCGCRQMTIRTAGESTLRDPGRPIIDPVTGDVTGLNPAPLGRDPDFVSFNFEVVAELTEGSDPALCQEGQTAKGTSTIGAGAARHKRACTNRDLPVCIDNADCDTQSCRGGLQDGRPCNDQGASVACLIGGGACASNNDGICGEFPLAGAARGNDDYHRDFPGDAAPKLHCPNCSSPIWLDLPGFPEIRQADMGVDFRFDVDFFAFVNGNAGRCACHFILTIDWDSTNHVYRPATALTPVRDAETTHNCIFEP